MNHLAALREKIERKEARLAVVGLGYVGLTAACLFAESGYDVLGIEQSPKRVELIRAGKQPFYSDEPFLADLLTEVTAAGRLKAAESYQLLADRDVVLITVETPIDELKQPNYQALRRALQDLGAVLKPGALVIVESTLAPGTIQDLVLPLLSEATQRQVNDGFYLGHCPERVMPGRLIINMRTMSRVVGGYSFDTALTMVSLYRQVVQADLTPVDCLTAELVKTVENAYRDVQIAFANEIAQVCEALGADAWQVRELVNQSPNRQMHMPGAGVGGHCIPKDPWLLAYGVHDKDVPLRLIPTARVVNDSMPMHLLDLLHSALEQADRTARGSSVLILGYAYLENSDDIRNSPSKVLVDHLILLGAHPVVHDPYVPEYQGDPIEMAAGCDAVVLMVRHTCYQSIDLQALKVSLRTPIIIDGRNVFDRQHLSDIGFISRCVGKGWIV